MDRLRHHSSMPRTPRPAGRPVRISRIFLQGLILAQLPSPALATESGAASLDGGWTVVLILSVLVVGLWVQSWFRRFR